MITVGVSNACQKLKNGKVQNVSRLIQEGTMGAMPPPQLGLQPSIDYQRRYPGEAVWRL